MSLFVPRVLSHDERKAKRRDFFKITPLPLPVTFSMYAHEPHTYKEENAEHEDSSDGHSSNH